MNPPTRSDALRSGLVQAVLYRSSNEIVVAGGLYCVSDADADLALEARRAGRKVEIVPAEGGGVSVRLAPAVVVKWRGKIASLRTDTGAVWIGCRDHVCVSNIRDAARAYADDAEVEIVSIDGGPDQVRVCE